MVWRKGLGQLQWPNSGRASGASLTRGLHKGLGTAFSCRIELVERWIGWAAGKQAWGGVEGDEEIKEPLSFCPPGIVEPLYLGREEKWPWGWRGGLLVAFGTKKAWLL